MFQVSGLPQLIVQEFANCGAVPCLFSQTRDFRFHNHNGNLTHRSLPQGPKGFHVVGVASTGHTASFVEHDRTAITIPIAGSSTVTVDAKTIHVRTDDLLVLGPSERRSNLKPCEIEKVYKSFTVISPPSESTVSPVAPAGVLHHGSTEARKLRKVLEFAFDFLRDDSRITSRSLSLIEALIEDMFVAALQSGSKADDGETCNSHLDRIVSRAQEYLHAHFSEPVSISEVAATIGIGRSSLHKAFRDRRAMTPREYLTGLRLESLRSALVCPDPFTSVTSAAMDAGFFHFGRCSAVYRARYGELPSTTLRAARETPGAGNTNPGAGDELNQA